MMIDVSGVVVGREGWRGTHGAGGLQLIERGRHDGCDGLEVIRGSGCLVGE